MTTNTFGSLYAQLSKVDTEEQLRELCESFCELSGFEYFLIGVICSSASLSAPSINTITNYPPEWFASYFDEGMQKSDPVVRYCLENTTPIRWDQLLELEQYIDPMGEKIMERAGEVGLCTGLSIPLKSPSGEIAIFSIATRNKDNIGKRTEDILPYAQAFSTALFENYSRINVNFSDPDEGTLTARETQCLFWACEGKTTWEISKIIDVSERTVIFHLTGATKKLGAVNRQHAVAKAIIRGLIKPTP